MTSCLRAAAFALLVPIAATTTAACNRAEAVVGTWDTVYGGAAAGDATLTLTGSGKTVSGAYGGTHTGTMTGTMNGNVLSGRWKESETPKGQGSYTFTFANDTKSFKGLFRSDDGTFAGSWDGRRK